MNFVSEEKCAWYGLILLGRHKYYVLLWASSLWVSLTKMPAPPSFAGISGSLMI